MPECINNLETIRAALGTLEITTTRHNLDTLLGSMQLLDRVIACLQQQPIGKEPNAE